MESNGVAEGSGTKAEEAEEAKSSDGEDPEISSRVEGVDQLVGYIVHFDNAFEMYQRKKPKLFRMW